MQPVLLSFLIRAAAGTIKSNATVAARFVQSGANEWALVVGDAAAVIAATDIITFLGQATV